VIIRSSIFIQIFSHLSFKSEVSESSIASAVSIKRAKAEAEKVRLELVKKESELLKQKAALEADICVPFF
jgi:hypothetical protein